MAHNPFIGLSQEVLEAALLRAQTELLSGKNTVQVNSGDVSRRSEINIRPELRIAMIRKALNLIDPDAYPAASITPSSVVRVAFSTPASQESE